MLQKLERTPIDRKNAPYYYRDQRCRHYDDFEIYSHGPLRTSIAAQQAMREWLVPFLVHLSGGGRPGRCGAS